MMNLTLTHIRLTTGRIKTVEKTETSEMKIRTEVYN